MIVLSAEEIESILSIKEILAVLKQTLENLGKGYYEVPDRLHLEQGDDTYLIMPALGPKYLCTKIISVLPNNPNANLPLITGTLQLIDATTGSALALLDAPMITALRTAAIGALGMDLIAPKGINSIGIIGCGLQGTWQSIFACTQRPIQQLNCYSRSPGVFEKYQAMVHQHHPQVKIQWYQTAEEAVEKSQVIYTCTNSPQPVFENSATLVQGKRFISVGSFRKDMQELPAAVYQAAQGIIVDAPAAPREVGDIINALQQNWLKKSDHQPISYLYELVNIDPEKIRKQNFVFKSVGMAAFDLGLATAIFEKKIEK